MFGQVVAVSCDTELHLVLAGHSAVTLLETLA